MMDLSKILSISGKPGLYQMLAQTKTGMVVESITDKKRFTAFAHQQISSLEEISVFTTGEDMPLKDIMKMIFDFKEGKEVDPMPSQGDMGDYFAEIVLDYDNERVYNSDIKKILNWYNLLVSNDLLEFEEEESEEEENSDAEGTEEKKEETSGKDSPEEEAKD